MNKNKIVQNSINRANRFTQSLTMKYTNINDFAGSENEWFFDISGVFQLIIAAKLCIGTKIVNNQNRRYFIYILKIVSILRSNRFC